MTARDRLVARTVALLALGYTYAQTGEQLGVSRRQVQVLEQSYRAAGRRAHEASAEYAALGELVAAETERLNRADHS